MASSTIKIKTDTEHLLYNYYNEEKAAREALQVTVKTLENQIEILQQQLKSLTEEKSTNKNVVKEKPLSSVEYTTDEEELARETEWIRAKGRKKRKLNISPTQRQDETKIDNNISKQDKEKARRIPATPPIIVDNVKNYQAFFDLVSEIISEDLFSVKMMNGESVKINAVNDDAYRAITQFLNQNKYLWHSYENKQERPIRVMVKKLHFTCQPTRIIEDLKNKGFKIEEAVNKLRWKDKTPLNMFMLTFKNGEDINKIFGIKSILGCKIEIHPLKTPKLVPQCKRCQSYGHTQKYCSKEPRCVKCTGKHLTQDCKKPAEEKPKCVHCGAPHPANYRGCMVAKEMQNLKNKTLKKRNTQSTQHAQATTQHAPATKQTSAVNKAKLVSKNVTYAQITTNKDKTHVRSGPENTVEEKLNEILRLMSAFDIRLKKLESSNIKASFSQKK